MANETLEHVLIYFLEKLKDVRCNQSPELLQKLTLSQYKASCRAFSPFKLFT